MGTFSPASCQVVVAIRMLWSNDRRRRRRGWLLFSLVFALLFLLVFVGTLRSGVAGTSGQTSKGDGQLSGFAQGFEQSGSRQQRVLQITERSDSGLHSWASTFFRENGIPFLLGRSYTVEERVLHFRKPEVSDFFEAAAEWPEGNEAVPEQIVLQENSLETESERENVEKIESDRKNQGELESSRRGENGGSGFVPELVILDEASPEDLLEGGRKEEIRGLEDPIRKGESGLVPELVVVDEDASTRYESGSNETSDFRSRDPEFDAQPHTLGDTVTGSLGLAEEEPLRADALTKSSSSELEAFRESSSLDLEAGIEQWLETPSPTVAPFTNPFADPESAPMLVLPLKRTIKVYVYELPPHLNRDFVVRDPRVRQTMFATEVLIHEDFEQSAVRTFDPEEADFYFIPVYTAGVLEDSGRVIPDTSARTMLEAVTFVAEQWPYFNRLRGLDHVVVAPHDYGACFQYRDELASQTKFRMVLRYLTVLQTFGVHNHVCYREGKSVVIPPYIDVRRLRQLDFVPERDAHKKHFLAFFRGLYIDAGNDPSGRVYSRGVRLAIGQTFHHNPAYDISDAPSPTYLHDMINATFCLCPLGWAPWSPRIFESVQIGCIPVIIADDIILPFENYFNWERIAVRVMEADVPRLEEILRAIPPSKVAAMQKAMWEPQVRQALIFPEPAEPGDAFEMVLNELEAKAERIRKKKAEYFRKTGQ